MSRAGHLGAARRSPKPVSIASISLIASLALACGGGDGNSTSAAPTRPPAVERTATSGGPSVSVEPKSGPPGTELTIKGTGWPASADVIIIGDVAAVASTKPYATVKAGADGNFVTSFRIEKAPDGTDLKVGRFDLIARAGSTDVKLPFQVEVRRPVGGAGGGAGGG